MQAAHINYEQKVTNLAQQMTNTVSRMSPNIYNLKPVRVSSGSNQLASAAISELIKKEMLKGNGSNNHKNEVVIRHTTRSKPLMN